MAINDVMNPAVKNPLTFENPQDRQASTLHIAQRVQESPKFKALPPEKQQQVLGHYYDAYVTKAYGHTAPDKDTWVKGVAQRSKFGDKGFLAKPDDFYNNTTTDLIARVGNSAGLKLVGLCLELLVGALNLAWELLMRLSDYITSLEEIKKKKPKYMIA